MTAKIIGYTVLAFILFFGFAAAIFGLEVATAGIVGKGKAHIEIQSAPSRLGGYNHFFDLCASIQNAEAGIDAQSAHLDHLTDPNEISRVQTNIDGLQITRANGINQYNADAAKDYTIGQFRDAQLPYHIDATPYKAGGEHTRCTY